MITEVTHNNMPQAIEQLLLAVNDMSSRIRAIEEENKMLKAGKGDRLVGMTEIAKGLGISKEKIVKLKLQGAPIYENGTGGRATNYCYRNEMDAWFASNTFRGFRK